MPKQLILLVSAVIGAGAGTIVKEGLEMTPKAVGVFYVAVAKSCYVSTGSKRVACGVAALTCVAAVTPGAHQGPFIAACAAAARGASKLV
jgi:hypothetical protein